MDPLTHGLTGAAAAQSVSDKEKHRPAAITAFAAALLPDIEMFIHHPSDPLFNLEIHRQFTHSFFFIPAGALISALLIWWFMRKQLNFREIYLFSLLGYATHGLLDAITSYGTELLWPFFDTRISWNLIPVVDPVFTAGIFILAGIAFYSRKKAVGMAVFIWIVIYVMAGFVQRERGAATVEALADARGHTIEQMVVKPTIGNLILWRGTYIAEDTVHVDAIRSGLFSSRVYPGTSAPLITPERDYADFHGTTLYNDIRRFQRFSDGYLIRHPDKHNIIGDGRYAMLPNDITPLWGIRADTLQPGKHVPFLHFRETGPEVREPFMEMLTGSK